MFDREFRVIFLQNASLILRRKWEPFEKLARVIRLASAIGACVFVYLFLSSPPLAKAASAAIGLFVFAAIAWKLIIREAFEVTRSHLKYKHASMDADQTLLSQSTANFLNLSKNTGYIKRALGSAIEIESHSLFPPTGWSPNSVYVGLTRDSPKQRDVETLDRWTETLDQKMVKYKNDDREKFSAVKIKAPSVDGHISTRVDLWETRYSYVQAAQELVSDAVIRHQLMSLKPELHRIPSNFCGHFIAITADQKVLCQHRRVGSDYRPGRVSISFEEQLARNDLRNLASDKGSAEEYTLGRFVVRAICEEILPLRHKYALEGDDERACFVHYDSIIDDIQLVSFIMEEDLGNISCCFICHLATTTSDFVGKFRQLSAHYGSDGCIDEGEIYIASFDEICKLLKGETVLLSSPFEKNSKKIIVGHNIEVDEDESIIEQKIASGIPIRQLLHDTSLMRLRMLMLQTQHRRTSAPSV